MADTTFTDGSSVIYASWLNEINDFYHTLFAASTTASAARTAIGLGTIATQDASNVTITGGSVTGITELDVADSTAAVDARLNLGVYMPPSSVGWLCPHKNLRVDYASATTATVASTEIWLESATGTWQKFTSLSVTLDIAGTADAALGLVGISPNAAAAEANSTWYHIWAIGKTDGTVSAVLSVASPAATQTPTLPTGYTYYGYVGALYNDSSGNFDTLNQRGNVVASEGNQVLNAGTTSSMTSVSLAAAIPTTARYVNFRCDAINVSGGANGDPVSLVASNSGGTIGAALIGTGNANASGSAIGQMFIPILTAQTVWYNSPNGTSYATSLYVWGWEY